MGKAICVICKEKKVFGDKFDKCMTCAMEYRDKMRNEFVTLLTPEQLVIFETYNQAREDFTSMIILD